MRADGGRGELQELRGCLDSSLPGVSERLVVVAGASQPGVETSVSALAPQGGCSVLSLQ